MRDTLQPTVGSGSDQLLDSLELSRGTFDRLMQGATSTSGHLQYYLHRHFCLAILHYALCTPSSVCQVVANLSQIQVYMYVCMYPCSEP